MTGTFSKDGNEAVMFHQPGTVHIRADDGESPATPYENHQATPSPEEGQDANPCTGFGPCLFGRRREFYDRYTGRMECAECPGEPEVSSAS